MYLLLLRISIILRLTEARNLTSLHLSPACKCLYFLLTMLCTIAVPFYLGQLDSWRSWVRELALHCHLLCISVSPLVWFWSFYPLFWLACSCLFGLALIAGDWKPTCLFIEWMSQVLKFTSKDRQASETGTGGSASWHVRSPAFPCLLGFPLLEASALP